MNIEKIKKLFGIKRGEIPVTKFIDNMGAVKVEMIDWPDVTRLESVLVNMSKASWFRKFTSDPEVEYEDLEDEIDTLYEGRTLGQGLEHATFCFIVEGLSLHGTHALVRNRIGVAYMQQSQAVKDFRHSDVLVPRAFTKVPELLRRYERWVIEGKQLYADMLDSGEIANTDARFCLPKTIPSWCYVSISLPTLLNLYGKRSDTQEEHPEMNIMAEAMRAEVVNKIAFLTELFVRHDDVGKCLHQRQGYSANCIFKRDEKHQLKPGMMDNWTLHDKTKQELMLTGNPYIPKTFVGVDEVKS